MEWIWALVSAFVVGLGGWIAAILTGRKALARGKREGADEFLRFILAGGYETRTRAFRELNRMARPGGIVFVGDSITQDYPVWEYFPDLPVYNRGIGGDTTEGLKKRLEESVFELRPQAVVLLIGTNDLALLKSTPETIAANIRDIIVTIQTRLPECRILLESVYPVIPDGKEPPERDNADICRINDLISAIPGVEYVDLHSQLRDENGNLRAEYTVEGLHINQTGYALITQELRRRLKA
jgi:lysophospholipase L1-like esterase